MKVKLPLPTVETADLAVIRWLLPGTDMAAALPAQQLHHDVRSAQLLVLDVQLHTTRRDIGLIVRAAGTSSPTARALIDAIWLPVADVASIINIGSNQTALPGS